MKLLAFDTSTDTLSVAVSRDDQGSAQLWQYSGVGGARASTTLIPTVLDLLRQAGLTLAELDAVCFGAGPGSFTGLRTACSVAQGLAFGAGVPVLPVDSLLALAEAARFEHPAQVVDGEVVALLDARMDEIYHARFHLQAGHWSRLSDSALVRPQALVQQLTGTPCLVGNVFAVYALPLAEAARYACVPALPDAAAMLRLAPQLLAAGGAIAPAQALPTYIRDKVARTTAERAADKAAATP